MSQGEIENCFKPIEVPLTHIRLDFTAEALRQIREMVSQGGFANITEMLRNAVELKRAVDKLARLGFTTLCAECPQSGKLMLIEYKGSNPKEDPRTKAILDSVFSPLT